MTPATAAWLAGPAGSDAVATARRWHEDGQDDLKVAERLRSEAGLDPVLAGAAHTAARLQVRGERAGHPAGWLWTRSGLEQASHPAVARWRARRYAGAPAVADLTVGCGADARALAEHAPTAGFDIDPIRLVLARANLAETVPVARADATRPVVATDTWRWADPSRRSEGRRLRGLDAARPALTELLGGGPIGVAVSPAVDLADPALPADAELEFVQVGAQLVEAVVWTAALRDHEGRPTATRSATILSEGQPLHHRGSPSGDLAGQVRDVVPGEVLVAFAPALVRARLHEELAGEWGLDRVARRRALFVSSTEMPASPWSSREVVVAVTRTGARQVRRALDELDVAEVEVLTHGIDTRPRDLLRALGSPPTGPHGHRIHLVRTDAGAVAIVTSGGVPSGRR